MGVKRATEKGFQRAVVQYARLHHWRVAHFPRVKLRRRKGAVHLTAVAYDGAGWPDLCLAKVLPGGGGRVIFAELKSDSGRVSSDQQEWAGVLAAVGGTVEYYLWCPTDWSRIEEVLGG